MGIIGGIKVESRKRIKTVELVVMVIVMNHRVQIPGLIVRLSSLGLDLNSPHCCLLESVAE